MRYLPLRPIATGSMGTLYKSVDPETGRPVAVKTVRRDLLDARDEHFAARLRIEAQAARGLIHPGIVAVYEYGEEEAYAYIVMEYVEGETLEHRIAQGGSIGIASAVDIMSQLLEALQFAHDRGIWHRDIKPANILITNAGQVKVTDFGIARIAAPMSGQPDPIMGTPGYIC